MKLTEDIRIKATMILFVILVIANLSIAVNNYGINNVSLTNFYILQALQKQNVTGKLVVTNVYRENRKADTTFRSISSITGEKIIVEVNYEIQYDSLDTDE